MSTDFEIQVDDLSTTPMATSSHTPIINTPKAPNWSFSTMPTSIDTDTPSSNVVDAMEVKALTGLRQALNKTDATWTTDAQRDGVLAALKLEQDVLAIMRTGSGKTMLAIIPALLEENKITVVILPLKSLMTDYTRRLSAMGIPFEQFEGQKTSRLHGRHNLILVSADMVKFGHWKQCIAELHETKEVVRAIFDEGHFALTGNDFRSALQDLYEVRQFPMQLIVLSGTVPPSSEEALISAFGLESPLVLRTETSRPELEYILEPKYSSNESVLQRIQSILVKHLMSFETQDRALIFVPFIEEGVKIADTLGCEFYQGSGALSDTERQEIYLRWIDGRHKVMVCTAAFGVGNDYGHVRLVIHAGTPGEMIGFTQEVSRAGRDGKHATSYTLPRNKSKHGKDSDEVDHRGRQAMEEWVFGKKECLRFGLTQFSDGKGIRCMDRSNTQLCSHCQKSRNSQRRELATPRDNAEAGPSNLGKRKEREPASGFVKAAETAKRRRLGRLDGERQYTEGFKEALSKFKGICALCKVWNTEREWHSVLRCPTLETEIAEGGREEYLEWRSAIKYGKDHKKICWRCHVPQTDDTLHRTFAQGGDACDYPDVIAPVAYGVYWDLRLRSQGEERFSTRWETIEEYVLWLNKKPDVGEKSNITGLFLWYCKIMGDR